jgi:hypothetical protein
VPLRWCVEGEQVGLRGDALDVLGELRHVSQRTLDLGEATADALHRLDELADLDECAPEAGESSIRGDASCRGRAAVLVAHRPSASSKVTHVMNCQRLDKSRYWG